MPLCSLHDVSLHSRLCQKEMPSSLLSFNFVEEGEERAGINPNRRCLKVLETANKSSDVNLKNIDCCTRLH